jgi:hypothetical protein
MHVKITAIYLFREARHTTIFWSQRKVIDWAKGLQSATGLSGRCLIVQPLKLG